ncbi:MAG: FG-GAP repeat domain-containing protein [Chloroflexota bacterium]
MGTACDTSVTREGAEIVGFFSRSRPIPFRVGLRDGRLEVLQKPFDGPGFLTGIDASGSGEAWIVGARMKAGAKPVAARRDDGALRRLPVPPLGSGGVLTDVHAIDGKHAIAVGYLQSRLRQAGLILRWQAGVVRRERIPVTADTALVAVAQPGPQRAIAVGWVRSQAGLRPLLLERERRGWVARPVGLAIPGEALLTAIARLPDGRVVAGGTRRSGRAWVPFLLEETEAGWRATDIGAPGDDGTVGLVRTLLVRADEVIVGGARWAPGSRPAPLFGHWVDGTWREEPIPGDPVLAELMGADEAGGAAWIVGGVARDLLALRACTPDAYQARTSASAAPWAPTPVPEPSPEGAAPSPSAVPSAGPAATGAPPPPKRAGVWRVRASAPLVGPGFIPPPSGAGVGALDGDGRPDIALGGHSRPLKLLRNERGAFVPADAGTFPRLDRHGCAIGNVDGAGTADIVCTVGAHHGTGFKQNEVWLDPISAPVQVNRAEEYALDDPFGRGRNALLFDADNDGDDDLLVTNEPGRYDALPSTNRFYRNADGRFIAAPGAGLDSAIGGGCVIPADIDGDGWTDLVLCGWVFVDYDAFLRVFRNRKGRFEEVTAAVRLGGLQVEDAAVTDVNGDRRPDVVQVAAQRVRVSVQAPDGTFVTVFELATTGAKAVAAGDADGDGDSDLYVMRTLRGRDLPDMILLNRGDGLQWTRIAVPAVARGTGDSVVAIDEDRDGTDAFLVLNGSGLAGAGPVQLIRLERP